MSTPFHDRTEAGERLGAELAGSVTADSVVLGLARGGVEVAAPVAAALGARFDVLVVRKIGHPRQPELGLGAFAEDGPVLWDDAGLALVGLTPAELEGQVNAEREECRRRVSAYRSGRPGPDLAGRTVVLVDDGVATGVSARAAVEAVRAAGAATVVLATPVAAAETIPTLEAAADRVVTLEAPHRFGAVSRWYAEFPQTSDETVVGLLSARWPTP